VVGGREELRLGTEERKLSNKITPFLMFEGRAEEAMNFYVSLFAGSEIQSVSRYGPGETGPEGTIERAYFSVAGQVVMCTDSPIEHAFSFTPSFSFFVECENEDELDNAFDQLSNNGDILMPPDDYGFSKKFTWVSDRFGVSWQLNFQ
jgi:predicted 3-demethylubiquinone-9 3-methyltransferase (glyoxalase superfamily)